MVKNKKGCYVLSIVNLGKSQARLHIELKGKMVTCKDLLTGLKVADDIKLKPLEVFFAEVEGTCNQ